jgi:branched-chain amino acid transport system permease protein
VESVGGAFFGDGYRDVVGFVVFLIVLSFRPAGLFGRRFA